MKLRKSQRIMSLFLSLLMLLSTFAGSGFTVRAAEPTEVEAGDLDETSAAPTEVEGDDIDPDADAKPLRVLTVTPSTVTTLNATYGTAISAAKWTVKKSRTIGGETATLTSIGYKVMVPAAGYDDADIKTGVVSEGDNVDNGTAKLVVGTLPAGLEAKEVYDGTDSDSDAALVIEISGTPIEIKEDSYYLVVSDRTAEDDNFSKALDEVVKVDIKVSGITPDDSTGTTAGTGNNITGKAITFKNGTSAAEGYEVGKKLSTGSTADLVTPFELTITPTGVASGEDKGEAAISAAIVPFDTSATDTAAVVQSTITVDGKQIFTVSPATVAKANASEPAKFTIAPAAGLLAKDKSGTTYKAKLEITSPMFAKITYTLSFTVGSSLGFDEDNIKTHKDAALAGDGLATASAYDLGTLHVGETIDDVVIPVKGVTGTLSYEMETSSLGGLDPLPNGLSLTQDGNSFKLGGMISLTDAKKYLASTGVHYFALNAKSSTGAETGRVYFKYTVADAEIEMYLNDGVYDEATATKVAAGGSFDWFGVTESGADLANEYATVYLVNKSGVPVKLVGSVTTNATGTFGFDPESLTENAGITIPAASGDTPGTVSFKVIPKTTVSKATAQTLTLKGDAINAGGYALTLKYTKKDNLEITKPSEDYAAAKNNEIGTAYLGDAFSYTFEATYPTSVGGVTWSVTSVKEITANTTSTTTAIPAKLTEYGLRLDGATLSTTALKKVDTTGLELIITATGVKTGTTTRTVRILTKKPVGIKLTAGTKKIDINGSDGTAEYKAPDVRIDALDSDELSFTITNDTKVKLSAVVVGGTPGTNFKVSAVDTAGTDKSLTNNDQYKIVFDENATKNTKLAAGIDLAAGEEASFKVVPDTAKVKTAGAGTYTILIKITNDNLTTTALTITQKVTDVPIITWTNGTITTGTAVNTSNSKYATTLAGAAATVEYSLISGEVPGLELDGKNGYWKGTPTTAGEYEVTVRATTADNKYGELTHKIKVTGAATLTAKQETTDTVLEGKTYLLPGKVEGYSAKTNEIIAYVTTDVAAAIPEVTIEDAADDRAATEDLDGNSVYDILESDANPYEGDKAYVTATLETTDTIESGDDAGKAVLNTGKNYKLTIGTAAGAKAGVHKATVTIKAKNAEPISLDVCFVVSEKLVISAPAAASGVVNKAIGAKAIPLTATGGNGDQTIVWSEKKDSSGSVDVYYVTDTGASGTKSSKYGLKLETEGDTINAANGAGLVNYITGTPELASTKGAYNVKLGAEVAAIPYAVKAGSGNGAKDINVLLDGRITSNANNTKSIVDGTNSAVIAKQTAEEITLPITIAKNSDPQITDVTNGQAASTGKMDTEQGYGVVTGEHLGNAYSKITKYVFPEQTINYAVDEATLKVTGGDGTVLKYAAKLGKGTASDFRIGTSSNPTGTTIAEKTLTAAGESIYVDLVTGRSVGTYTDTLTLSSDTIADIVINLEFTVAPASYKATVDNNIAATDANADERIVYIDGIADGTGTENIELEVADSWTSSTGSQAATPKTIKITNSGNTAWTALKVKEVVKNGANWNVPTTGDLVVASSTTNLTNGTGISLGASASDTFTLNNVKSTSKKDKIAYVEISYKDAEGEEHDIYLPVHVVVLNPSIENVSTDPATATVALPDVNEFFTSKDGNKVIKLSNNESGDANVLKGVTASFNGGDVAAFDATPVLSSTNVKAGESIDITIKPKAGTAAGTYTSQLTINADNLKTAIQKTVTLTVAENNSFVADKVTSDGITITEKAVAEKLYNTLVVSGISKNANAKTIYASHASGKDTVLIDFDKEVAANTLTTSNSDLQIEFTGTDNDGGDGLKAVSSVKITRLTSGFNLTAQPKKIVLAQEEKTKGKAGIGDKKVYDDLTFKLYGKVDFVATTFGEQYADMKAYDENLTTTGTPATSGTDKGKAVTDLSTIIPIGSTLGSVFSGGVLPTAEDAGKAFTGWYEDADNSGALNGTEAKLTATDKITKDYVKGTNGIKPLFDEFKYAGSNGATTTDSAAGVTWTWTKNGNNYDAVLTLTDVSGKYDEASKIEVTKDDAANKKLTSDTYPVVKTPLAITRKNDVEATCTTGSGSVLEATVALSFKSTGDDRTYTGKYELDTNNDALGHTWLDPVVTWTDKNNDGKYTADEVTVKRTCSVCGETVDLTVTNVVETITVAPTCTKDGKASYSVVYTDVDKFAVAAGSVTDTKNVKESTIKATGHSYSLVVEWNDDHKSAKSAHLICSVCAEGEEGHDVDVTASVTYDIQTDRETGDVLSVQAIYAAGTDNEVKSEVWVSHTDHSWVVNPFVWASDSKSATATATCSVGGETKGVSVVMSDKTNGEGENAVTAYTATVSVDPEGNKLGKVVSETKYVWTATGQPATKSDFTKAAGASDSGKTISEPEDSTIYNLFYTDNEIQISLPEGYKTDNDGNVVGSGKWTGFYTVDSSGNVKLKVNSSADFKKAATAANSLIVIPLYGMDDNGNEIEIGEYEYQLPVSFVKPTLKLTSTKGTVKKGGEAVELKTVVTEKKSTGAFEALDVTDQMEGLSYWAGKSGSAVAYAGDNTGEVVVLAAGKAGGKIVIQLQNWSDKVELNYSVAESAKNVITTDVKSINMNLNAAGANNSTAQDAQTVNVSLNGSEDFSEDITATLPKNWDKSGLEVDGISEGKLDDSKLSFSFKSDATPKAGTYSIKLATADKASATVKVVVSKLTLDKAVTLKVQAKMNLTTGQKMVLIPTLKGISGEIGEVSISDDTNFEVEYIEELGQIIVSAVDASKLSTKTQYTPTLTIEVGGVDCTAALKFKPVSTKPGVKIAKVKLPKSKLIAGTAEGEANVLATYKQGGKTFSIAPVENGVKFTDGVANSDLGDGWYSVSKANVAVKYNAESGTIEVKALSGNTKGKGGSVKVELTYAGGVTVKKTLSVGVDSKK